jgi:hypothetical protein
VPRNQLTAAFVGALLCFAPGVALADDIPADIQGLWGIEGDCGNQASVIALGSNTLRFQDADEDAGAVWTENDSPSGHGAVHFAEEGDVSNFEYDPDKDVLLFNEQGYGMGVAPIVYTRCES